MFRKQIFLLFALVVIWGASRCATATTPAPLATNAPTIAPTLAPTFAPTSAPTAVPPAATATPSAVTFSDDAGRKVTLNAIPQRIISLAPSNTEILFALGLGLKTVGVDDLSDYPAEAKALPKVGGSGGKYNLEQIVALKPDLVLVAGITPPDDIKKLEDLKLTVVALGAEKTTFDNIIADITLVGQIADAADPAQHVTDAMKQKLDSIQAKITTAKTKPRVYWELDATDPAKPFSVGPGSFVNEFIARAGGTNIFGSVSSPYPQVSAEQVVSANPEVIILSDAAYGVTVDSVLKRPGWQVIDAVKKKQVYPIDDNLVSRPGPRVADGLEAAAKIIHPELFP